MKTARLAPPKRPRDDRAPARVNLGKYIVADSQICHGKPTFKGNRIMVWQLFEHLALGEPLERFFIERIMHPMLPARLCPVGYNGSGSHAPSASSQRCVNVDKTPIYL